MHKRLTTWQQLSQPEMLQLAGQAKLLTAIDRNASFHVKRKDMRFNIEADCFPKLSAHVGGLQSWLWEKTDVKL